jgi:ribose transport system permease protein
MLEPADHGTLRQRRRWRIPSWSGALLALGVLVIATAYDEPKFLQLTNILNILEQNAAVGMVAVGMTLIITLGGIDLSAGSLLALAGGLGILAMNRLYGTPTDDAAESMTPILAAVGVTVGVGLAAGLFNGVLVTKGRIAPFIATLAGLLIFRSAAMWVARGGQFFSEGSSHFEHLGEGFDIPGTNISRNPRRVVPAVFPYAIIIWAAIALLAVVLLHRTRLGRYIIAIGNNERAARYSAVAVDRVKIATYTLMGGIAGVAALMNAANYTSVNSANTGTLLELDAIAAVVIGGTRMEGGSGSVFGTILGVLLLGVIRNMMVMRGIDTYAQGVVTGGIIVAAVLLQRAGARRA